MFPLTHSSQLAANASTKPPDLMSVAASRMKVQQWRYFICILHTKADVVLFVHGSCDPAGRWGGGTQARSRGQVSRLCIQQIWCANPLTHSFPSSYGDSHHRSGAAQEHLGWLKHLRNVSLMLSSHSAGPDRHTNLASGTAPALLPPQGMQTECVAEVIVVVVGFSDVGKSAQGSAMFA